MEQNEYSLLDELLGGNLLREVSALILIDELGDPFSLKLTSVSKGLGIGIVGKTEI